ncbi:unnamed protein product, partial [Musa banksii]
MAFLADLANVIDGATAMVAAVQSYGADISLWAPPQTERYGYWPDATSASPSGEAARKELPRPGTPPDATVCKDGRCQFRAVQAAVDAALIDGTSHHLLLPTEETLWQQNLSHAFDHSLSLSFCNRFSSVCFVHRCEWRWLQGPGPGLRQHRRAGQAPGRGLPLRQRPFRARVGGVPRPPGHALRPLPSPVLQVLPHLRHLDFVFGNSATVFCDCLIFILPRQLNPEHGESNTVT